MIYCLIAWNEDCIDNYPFWLMRLKRRNGRYHFKYSCIGLEGSAGMLRDLSETGHCQICYIGLLTITTKSTL